MTLTWSGTQVLESSCTVKGSDLKEFTFANKTATVNPTTATSYTVACTTNSEKKTISASNSVSIAMDTTTPTTNSTNTPPVLTIPTVPTNPGVIITVNVQNSVTVVPGTSVALAYALQGVNQSNCTITLSPAGASPMFTNNVALVTPTTTTSYTFSCPNPSGGNQLTSVATINVSTSGAPGSVGTLANCAGAQSGGFCWYLGALNQSCSSVCASHGGVTNYNAYAGSAGTDANCGAVLGLLGISGIASSDSTICSSGWGCYTVTGIQKSRCSNLAVASDVASPSGRIACSCVQ